MTVTTSTLKAILEADTEGFKAGFGSALVALFDFKGAIDTVNQAVEHMRSKMAIEVAGVTATLTAATIAAIPFEQAIGDISTIVDTTKNSIESLSEGVLNVAGILKDDPVKVAAANYQVLSAGITDVNDSMLVLEKSGKLAKGGLSTTEEAVDLVTTALNSYGIAAKDVEVLTDQFMITTQEGKTTVAELAASFGNVAPLAVTAGLSIEELNAATAALTQNGIATSQAHTGVRAVLSALIKPSSEAAKLAKKLGIEFNTTGLASKGFIGFLADIQNKTKGDTEAISTLFGQVEGLGAVLALSGKASDSFARILGRLKTESGGTEEAFKKQLHPLAVFANNIKWIATEVGSRLLPIVNAIITPINNLFDWFQKLNPQLRKIIEWVAIIGAILAPFRLIIMAVGVGLRYIGVILPPLMSVASRIIPLVMNGLRFIFPWLMRLVPILLEILGLTNPIGWAIGGIIGLIAILQTNFLGLGDAATKIWNVVSASFYAILNAIFPINNILKALGININNFWNELGKILKAIEIALTIYIQKSVEQLVTGIIKATTIILNLIQQIKTFVIGIIYSIMQWINNAINWVQQQFNNLLNFFNKYKEGIKAAFRGMFGGAIDEIDKLISKYDELTESIKKWLPYAWAGAKIVNPQLGTLEDIIKGAMKAYDALGKATKKHNDNSKKGNKDNNSGLGETNDKLKKQKGLLEDINKILSQNFRLAMARAWKGRGSWIDSLNFPWQSGTAYGAQIGPNGVLNGGTQYTQGRNTYQKPIVYQFNLPNGEKITLEGPENPTSEQISKLNSQVRRLYDLIDDGILNNSTAGQTYTWTNP